MENSLESSLSSSYALHTTYRHLPRILSFIAPTSSSNSSRKVMNGRLGLILSAVSPLSRMLLLSQGWLLLGEWRFKRQKGNQLVIEYIGAGIAASFSLEPDCAPIGWWGPAVADMSVALKGPSFRSAALRRLADHILAAWGSSAITALTLEADAEPEPAERQHVQSLLAALSHSLVYLDVQHLRAEDVPPVTADSPAPCRLEKLSTQFYHGRLCDLGAWVKDSPLVVLQLCDTHTLTVEALRLLARPTLREIFLDGTNFMPSMMLAWAPCAQHIRRLSLVACDMVDEVDLSAFASLESLLLSRTGVAVPFIDGLLQCELLHYVNLGGCRHVYDVNALAGLPYVRQLFLHETSVTNAGIAELGRCELLEKLNLGGCISITDVNALKTLTSLKELHLWSTRVTDSGIAGLSGCVSLEELVLDNCDRVTDVSVLGGLGELRWLSLMQTNVDIAGIVALQHCPKLEALGIGGTRIMNAPKLWNHEAIADFLKPYGEY